MGERRTAHTVRSRKASATSQLGDDQLQRLIRASGDSARAETVVDSRAHDDLEAELEVVEPTPPDQFADGSAIEDVILLTQHSRPVVVPTPTGLWLRVAFVMVATAWIAARLIGA